MIKVLTAATVLKLCARSSNLPAGTATVTALPVGVTVILKCVASTCDRLTAVPPVTSMSSSTNVFAASSLLKAKVYITVPFVAADDVMATVGGTVSVAEPPPQALISKDAARAQVDKIKVFPK